MQVPFNVFATHCCSHGMRINRQLTRTSTLLLVKETKVEIHSRAADIYLDKETVITRRARK